MKDIQLLITGGKIVDGTGASWRYGDLAISNEKIIAIGKNIDPNRAEKCIDATGKIVCPGFIDSHSHVDITILAGEKVDLRLLQGITTEVVGQDGLSYAPVSSEHLQEWRKYLVGLNGDYGDRVSWDWNSTAELLDQYEGKAANIVHLIPHGAIRVEVMGWEERTASKSELVEMQKLVEKSISEGAAGISTGLTYIPCSHANTEEMIELCKPVGKSGGILSIHLRSYAQNLLEAIEEAILIGKESGAAIQLSHLRMADTSTWGLSGQVLELVEKARDEGIDVTYDNYPYTVGCAPLFCLIPAWAQSGGPEVVINKLEDQNIREKISDELESWDLDWSNYSLSNAPETDHGDWEGFSLTQAAKSVGVDVYSFIMDTLIQTKLDATIIAAGGNEADNLIMLKHSLGMIGSDGVMVGGKPHPRGYGTYPKILEKYVREDKVLGLEEAIHKMTGLPAARHNLNDRGTLKVGQAADIVVLSFEDIKDNSTFENPLNAPNGIETVILNGNPVVLNGKYLGSNCGKMLKPLIS